MMDQFIFWVAAIVAVIAAFRVVFLRNAIVSVLHLIVTLICLAVIFLQLSAEFLAALQVIVYGGAIMVLFLFIVMMLNLRKDEFGPDQLPGVRFLGALAAGALLGELFIVFAGDGSAAVRVPDTFGGVKDIGHALFGAYLFPFELTSILLLAAVIAAVVLAKRPPATETAADSAGETA
ncbi:MAG: NADH-quinone oxidoreductase subunit J [Candidatus Zixiibacteriota bacterium]